MDKKHTVVFTGGGTGGHIFPIIAIIRELKKIIPQNDLQIYYIGPRDEISKNYMEKEAEIRYIHTGKMRRYSGIKATLHNFIDIGFRVPLGIIQSFFYLYVFSPDMVFGKGGHGSLPLIMAARIFQIPVLLHESDSVLGATNQFLQKFCAEIFTSFPKTEKLAGRKMLVVGNPVRKEILNGDKEKAKQIFNFPGEKPVILILGGSQGSERINDLFLSASTGFLENFEVLHQCGENNYKQVSSEADATIKDDLRKNYHVVSFFNEEQMAHAYALADFVVSRAGAASIFEIAAMGKAGAFLPLPEAAQDHQVKNAYVYSATNAAVVFEEENLSSHFFLEKIKELFSPIEQVKVMEKNAKNFSKPRAGYIIATYIKEYLTRND